MGSDHHAGSGTDGVPDNDTGSLQYVFDKGGNDAPPTVQEATGAPIENKSPLGYSVGPFTILLMNISMMIGTGIFSTPSSILASTGSVGLSFVFWIIGFLLSVSGASVYLEFTAYFPSRSGSEVVFLEQAYPRPKFFFPTTFAAQNVILSFASSNAIVLANYLFKAAGTTGTDWQVKGVAVVAYTFVVLFAVFHTRLSYILSNAIGIVKVIFIFFMIITGLVVLGGHTKIVTPTANFKNAFEGSGSGGVYGIVIALYRIIFSYGGYNNAFNVVNEVKNPVRQLKLYGFGALFAVVCMYILTNVAYYATISKEDMENSGLTVASLFFNNIFGESRAVNGLNVFVALSSFGNMLSALMGSSRMIRECGRQGVLPWTSFWASTKPFGTPAGPYAVKWGLTVLMILAIPSGDAFNFINDLSIYPSAIFNLCVAVGLLIVRHRRKRANLPAPTFRSWNILVAFNILVQVFLLVMPWWTPPGGPYAGDVSFWYGTASLTGLGIVILCTGYYVSWAIVFPRVKGYRLRYEVNELGKGAKTHQIVKVPIDKITHWDATHDSAGNRLYADGRDVLAEGEVSPVSSKTRNEKSDHATAI